MDSGLIERMNAVFRSERAFEATRTRARQMRIAREQSGEQRRSVNGLGRVRMEIDPYVYHYWGQRLGYQCWKDKQFLREIERDNPEVRVRCAGTRTQVGYAGRARAGRGTSAEREVAPADGLATLQERVVRWRKVYSPPAAAQQQG